MMLAWLEALWWKSKVDQLEEEDQSKLKFQRPPKWLANHNILFYLYKQKQSVCFVLFIKI